MPQVVTPNNLANFGAGGYDNDVRKFGRIEALTASESGIVWDGGNGYSGWLNDITEDTEEGLSIVSDSADDVFVDGLGGHAGAELCQWTGQGKDGIEKTYAVPLNGTTPVLSLAVDPGVKYQAIYTAQTAGGLKVPTAAVRSNVGTITITSAISGKVMAIILPGMGRTQMMLWRCPKDHYAEFNKIDIYPVSNKPALIRLMGRTPLTKGAWIVFGQADVDAIGNITITFPFPTYIAPATDICVVIVAGVNEVDCSAQMWIKKVPITQYDKLLAEEG